MDSGNVITGRFVAFLSLLGNIRFNITVLLYLYLLAENVFSIHKLIALAV
jgi:hypothetical protein